MKSNIKLYPAITLLLCWLLCWSVQAKANVYTVTTTSDAGAGSLRTAMTSANTHIGLDTIQFNIGILLNTFESSGLNSWAVIKVNTVLPTITDPVLINGFTQTSLNSGSMPGQIVGADAYTQSAINYPDVYIVPSTTFSFPSSGASSVAGNGISIDAINVTIQGIAISGFGNTSNNSSTASTSSDIEVLRNATPIVTNININNCFISCDPRGAIPTAAERKTKGDAILICGYNYNGTIKNNYIAHPGTYGIHFNGGFDNLNVGPSGVNIPNQNWLIRENQILDMGTNTTTSVTTRSADAINFMHCQRLLVIYNYISDVEQVGCDIGYNASDNRIENNTFTGFVNTQLAPPMAAMRISLNSQRDSLIKNVVYNNTSTAFKAGVWMDLASLPATSGMTNTLNNSDNYIAHNIIHDNTSGSGIVMSNYTVGGPTITANNNTFTQNSFYNNAGLGIDLNFVGVTGSPAVTINDASDADAGVNNLQNFPIIDSAKRTGTNLTVWGKGPSGAVIEFFTCDGGINKFPSYTQNYGEGKTYLATGIEGSAADLATGTTTYADIDGNAGTGGAASYFSFSFTLPAATANSITSLDSLTSTATVSGSTSEFGPQAIKFIVLSCDLKNISGVYANKETLLSWNAICDTRFNYFNVEYSTDGTGFTTIGKVYGDFNNNNPKDYSFNHNNPEGYTNYYRLKMVDKDGNYKYSNVIIIRLKTTEGITIGPNPASDYVYINVTSLKEDNAQVRIVSPLGSVLFSKQQRLLAGTNSFTIKDISHYIAGVYIVQVVTNEEVKSQQLLIKR